MEKFIGASYITTERGASKATRGRGSICIQAVGRKCFAAQADTLSASVPYISMAYRLM